MLHYGGPKLQEIRRKEIDKHRAYMKPHKQERNYVKLQLQPPLHYFKSIS